MDEIWTEFKRESLNLIENMNILLEALEEDPTELHRMEKFGLLVDRIMGGAKNLALMAEPDSPIHQVAKFAELCKAIGYKASQAKAKPQVFQLTLAFLQDATEIMEEMLEALGEKDFDLESQLGPTLIDRLEWISKELGEDVRGTVALDRKEEQRNAVQEQIDSLLSDLGLRPATAAASSDE